MGQTSKRQLAADPEGHVGPRLDPGAAVRLTPAAAAAQDARIQEQHERAALNPVRAACPLTYACMGSKAVKLAGLDDKRQITVTVSGIYYR